MFENILASHIHNSIRNHGNVMECDPCYLLQVRNHMYDKMIPDVIKCRVNNEIYDYLDDHLNRRFGRDVGKLIFKYINMGRMSYNYSYHEMLTPFYTLKCKCSITDDLEYETNIVNIQACRCDRGDKCKRHYGYSVCKEPVCRSCRVCYGCEIAQVTSDHIFIFLMKEQHEKKGLIKSLISNKTSNGVCS